VRVSGIVGFQPLPIDCSRTAQRCVRVQPVVRRNRAAFSAEKRSTDMAGKSLNRVQLIGNLGKDPEIKYTPSGTPVAKIALATNERFKDKSGEWQDRTEWHNVVLWQRLAEIAGEYLKKGGKAYIEGRLQTRSWDDKNTNQKKYMTEVVANDLVLLGGRGESGAD